jgi:uncharacterized protein YbjT (DUF2867 family)
MTQRVAVTGATGHVGAELVRRLREKNVQVRAIARRADALKGLGEGVETAAGSLDDVAFLEKAFSGADAVFAMVPPSYGEADFRAYQRRVGDVIAGAVAAARVSRVVTLSSLGADKDGGNGPIAGLRDLEKRLEAVPGLHVVHLRPTYFMENELSAIGLIQSSGILGSPLKADAPIPMIASRDIAAVAAEYLAAPTFTGHAVRELLGPRDVAPRETAKILGAAIGRPDLPYVQFGYEDTRKALLGFGFSPDVARLFVEMYEGFNEGRIVPTQGRGAATTTPTTLDTFAREVFAPAYHGKK